MELSFEILGIVSVLLELQSKCQNVFLVSSRKGLTSSMRKMCGFTSCTCTKHHHRGICSPFIHPAVSSDSVSGEWRPWSYCAVEQADLGFRCKNILKDTFLHGAASVYYCLQWTFGCLPYSERTWESRRGSTFQLDYVLFSPLLEVRCLYNQMCLHHENMPI